MIVKDLYSSQLLRDLLYEAVPFDFCIGGKPFAAVLNKPIRKSENDGYGYEAYERYADNGSIGVRVSYKMYEYGALDFGLTLENTSGEDSEIITDVNFAHVVSPAKKRKAPEVLFSHLLYCKGSNAQITDWQPLDEDVREGKSVTLGTDKCRGTDRYFPYFNFELGDGTGFFAVVGWSGRWKATFSRHTESAEVVFNYPKAGFKLYKDESIALPRALIMPWKTDCYRRDVSDSFNFFRRFMREYIMPKQYGKEFNMPVTMRAWGDITPKEHKIRLANIKKYGLRAASYGIDAGWYELDGSGAPYPREKWHGSVGDWSPAPSIFPNGMGALAAKARDAGMGYWTWFEFERAVSGSASVKAHPEFYMISKINPDICAVNLSDPAARAYIFEKLRKLIDETQMNIFRIDFNFDPAQFFAEWEETERTGMCELQYYNGLYCFFEEMLKVYPDIVIDNCAGGGRRVDFRMCHYSIPVMCSSDYFCWRDFDPEGIQGHTWGISRWIPISGDSCGSCSGNTSIVMDTYRVRSSMRSSIGLAAPSWELSDAEGEWYSKMISDMERIAPYMSLDHYPLTGYNVCFSDWIAWERCDYDGSRGLIMAFRREEATESRRVFALRGLDECAMYRLIDIDDGEIGVFDSESLSEGFAVDILNRRQARIIFFERL
ncbi:MAG: alpha-galactosidase [Clostridia bacterium]|nr:alpha-galactosidase [Clostridia bacterium]